MSNARISRFDRHMIERGMIEDPDAIEEEPEPVKAEPEPKRQVRRKKKGGKNER